MHETSGWRDVLQRPALGDHIVQLYQDEQFLCDAVAEYLAPGLASGEGALVITRAASGVRFEDALVGRGVDAAAAKADGQLVVLDAEEMLESVMQGELPEWSAFHSAVGGAIATQRLDYPTVRAYGDMVDVLWQQGRREAALRLEEYWNELARLQTFSLLCAYRMDSLDAASYGGPLQSVCKAHTHLIPASDYERFDQAVVKATRTVLDESLAGMLLSLAEANRPAAEMPLGQAVLLWLKENMPLTAEKVLARAKEQV